MEKTNDDENQTTVRITVLASDVLSRPGLGRFAIDFASTTAKHPRLALDYCHNEEEIVGFAESFEFGDAGIFAVGTILKRPGVECRANEIADNIGRGVPYEASPLLDFTNAEIERVSARADAVVNGRRVAGPLDIYRGAVIRGLSVCPQGQDGETAVVAFSVQKKELETMDDEKNPGAAPDDKKTVNAELEAMIAAFGKERGVDYYLSGKTLEEAERDDYEQLKAARDKKDEDGGDDENGEAKTPGADPPDDGGDAGNAAPAPDDDKPKTAELKALKKGVDELKREIVALKAAVRRGADAPLATTPPASENSALTPLTRMALKFEKNGVVRNGAKK